MKLLLKHFLFVVNFLYTIHQVNAQDSRSQLQHEIDSLNKEFQIEKQDTVKVKLKYLIGKKLMLPRIGYWDTLIKEAGIYSLHLIEVKSLNQKAYFYGVEEKTIESGNCYKKSLEISKKFGFKNEMLAPNYNLTVYSIRENKTPKAREYCFNGLKIAEELNNKRFINKFTIILSEMYGSAGDALGAKRMLLRSLKLSRELDSKVDIAVVLMDLGTIYYEDKNIDSALYYYRQSINYVNEVPSITAVQSLNSFGRAYEIRYQFDSAIAIYKKAYNICTDNDLKTQLVATMSHIAYCHSSMGRYGTARKEALRALEIARTQNYRKQIQDILLSLKEICSKEKDYKSALYYTDLYTSVTDSIRNENNKDSLIEKQSSYNLEKKENENKLLAQQNQIQHLQLSQNKYLLFGFGGTAILILIIAYLIIRQSKLRNEHQKMHMEQKLISSQMNPHFVFNSLNAIQHLIMNKENDKAEFYLSKFSKLIRELLESNIKESLTVREEVGILTGYLEMEAKRFSKSFHYNIQIDEKIDQERVNIPHMMIQPFVENAIWHGLLPKEGERNLNIYYECDTEKTIRCVIEDNGIGREAAMKKENTFKKKSLALSFVRQRLELMQETLKVNCYIKIIDKKSGSGESLGTKILVVLPIMN